MTTASVSVITLAVDALEPARQFYRDGFGWAPVFASDEIVFVQLNGLVLGLWLKDRLAADSRCPAGPPGGFALAHNVATEAEVDRLIQRLLAAGGRLLREADVPLHGGRRGYVADPDGHPWEIAWNPGFAMDEAGNVTFGV